MNQPPSTIVLTGRLVRNPHAGEPFLSEARHMKLMDCEDFDADREIPSSSTAPILLTQRQHYELLGAVMRAVKQRMPAIDLILISTPRSYLNDLPHVLLDTRILIVGDSCDDSAALLPAAGDLLEFTFEPRRRPKDSGDNRIRIALRSESYSSSDLLAAIAAAGLSECIDWEAPTERQ